MKQASQSWQRLCALAISAVLAGCGAGTDTASTSNTLGTTSKVAPELNLVPQDDLLSAIDQASMLPLNEQAQAATATRFDATTVSADGTVIAFTVYVPNIAVGNSAPLLLEGHGWGGKRTRDLDTVSYEDLANTPLQTAKLALDGGMQGGKQATRGWYVISFDQRGFGESGGFANVMDPKIEGRDVQAIIDWAQANLPRLAYRKNKSGAADPVVGAVGLSYGGGYQLIGAGVDKRLDALVPTTTWYDLRYSLYDHPKSEYLSLLVGVGTAGLGRAEPFAYQAFVDASVTGRVSPEFSQKMYQHSAISYCEGNSPDMQQPGIPAFIIQASNDILFNLTEGFQAFECYRKGSPRSKLMAVRFGHPDLLASNTSGSKFTEENVACGGPGGASLPVARLAFSFLSQNLVDPRLDASHSAEYLNVPDIRGVLEDGETANGPKGETTARQCHDVARLGNSTSGGPLIMRGGASFPTVPASARNITLGAPAPLLSLIRVNDPATLAEPAMKAFAAPDAGTFVPLVSAQGRDRTMFGIPSVRMSIDATTFLGTSIDNAPILFVGLARKTAGGQLQLVHDQIQPVRGYGAHNVSLPGVSMLLRGTDELGLVVFGYHPQYYNYYTKIPATVHVTGITAGLPFVN